MSFEESSKDEDFEQRLRQFIPEQVLNEKKAQELDKLAEAKQNELNRIKAEAEFLRGKKPSTKGGFDWKKAGEIASPIITIVAGVIVKTIESRKKGS